MIDIDADIAVLGSGFGGSIMALMLERIGLRPVVFDRTKHPRFRIGESSTPTANMILRDLADRYNLPRLRPLSAHGPWRETYPDVSCGRKRGFSYFRHDRGEPFVPDSDHANELLVAASSDSYRSDTHWLRADVDAFLASEVQSAGITLLENTEVTGIERGNRWQVRARREKEQVRCAADFIVDATGGATLLSSLGFTTSKASLSTRSRAIYAHFTGMPRWRDWVNRRGGEVEDHPFPCDQAAVHHVLDEGWLWEFRFDDGRVSTGLVLDAEACPSPLASSPRDEWWAHLKKYPTLSRRFEQAELADPPGKIIRTDRLQHLTSRAAGQGWSLLPSTAGFIDPLHSTGIAHNLSGVERLCRLFENHGARPPSPALRAYSQAVRRELQFVDDLVRLCYESLPSFRAWTASTMFYFAAATTYERRRAHEWDGSGPPPSFLCAGQPELRGTVRRARSQVAQDTGPLDAYEKFVEEAVRPFNEVGLFDPPVPNMYPHTTAPIADG